jgi:hypothetical protein
MPTKKEREYYRMGFNDGLKQEAIRQQYSAGVMELEDYRIPRPRGAPEVSFSKPKRKLSAWQKYIKNKRNHIKYRDGKLNLKKMGVEFRRKRRR